MGKKVRIMRRKFFCIPYVFLGEGVGVCEGDVWHEKCLFLLAFYKKNGVLCSVVSIKNVRGDRFILLFVLCLFCYLVTSGAPIYLDRWLGDTTAFSQPPFTTPRWIDTGCFSGWRMVSNLFELFFELFETMLGEMTSVYLAVVL